LPANTLRQTNPDDVPFCNVVGYVAGQPRPLARCADRRTGSPGSPGAGRAPSSARPVLPSGRPDAMPAVAGTIGKDHALERVDKYCLRIGQPDLDGNNIKILFPDLV
jgi:hypothetical protein